jgi:mucin-2
LLPVLLFAMVVTVLLAPSSHPAIALAATNACKSNATATFSDISIGLTGTATPSAATVGTDTITLSGIGLTAAVPATLLIAGYNLGLLTTGSNAIPVKGWASIAASNTAEGNRTLTFTASVNTVITDPNGVPGTGDETATPLSLNVTLPSTTFTPTGGNVAFTQGAPGSLPAIPAGQVSPGATTPVGGIYISAQVAGGLVKANFDCQVGTTIISPPGGTSGTTFTPGTPGAFANVTVTGGTGGTTTSTTVAGSTSTSTTAPGTTTTSTSTPGTTTTLPATTTTTAGPVSGTATYSASCSNNVTADLAVLTFNGSGRVPGHVDADTPFTLDNMKWDVTIPAGVFQTGLNLGLISAGTPLQGLLDLGILGTNTAQGVQDVRNIGLTVPVLTDSAGAALPSTVKFDVPNASWTALTGQMDFSMNGAEVSVKVGPLSVLFKCKPTSGGPFVSTRATGVSHITTTTRVASGGPTVGAAGGTLVSTGPRDNLWIQLLAALVLLDLGYLTMSLLRRPRRRHT